MFKIMLSGGRGAGKDTAVEMFKKYLPQPKQMRLAQYVVDACKAFGIENPTRTELVLVGQEIGRKMIDENVWINMAINDIMSEENNWIVSDCRYMNEYEELTKIGFIPILIDCELETRIERVIKRDGSIDMKLLEGESEQTYKLFDYTIRLDNNGTFEELEEQIHFWATKLGGY